MQLDRCRAVKYFDAVVKFLVTTEFFHPYFLACEEIGAADHLANNKANIKALKIQLQIAYSQYYKLAN